MDFLSFLFTYYALAKKDCGYKDDYDDIDSEID